MKELLSIKEKAKRYDEALKVLHKYDGVNIMFSQSLKEEMFPELKESEDERIRKGIISGMKALQEKGKYTRFANIPMDNVFAWLEKQGEQEPFNYEKAHIQQNDFAPKSALEAIKGETVDNANKVEPKFKVGDIIKPKCYSETHSIKAIGECYYILDIDVKIPFRDEDDWELVGQNTAWSEEDKKMLDFAIRAVGLCRQYSINHQVNGYLNLPDVPKKYEELQDWLKSLRPQSQWKPSDEQMEALKNCCNGLEDDSNGILDSLYNDLKAL